MNEISTRIIEKVGSEKLTPVSITAGKGFVTQTEKFGRDISGDQYKNYILLREGEFAYNKGNSKKYAQGCVYKLKGFEKVAAPYAYISFRLNDGYESDFFQIYFEMNAHGKQLQKYITSGARSDGLLNIDPDDFFRISLATPSLPEQQRIADCLTSLDEVIGAEVQKLDSLKVHKKGLLQGLFPDQPVAKPVETQCIASPRGGKVVPKLRFPEFRDSGEWVWRKVGEIADVTASGDLDMTLSAPLRSENFPYPVYSNGVEKEGLYGYYSLPKYSENSVTITARGTLGAAFLRKEKFMGIGRLIVINNFQDTNAGYLNECWNATARIPSEVTSIPQLTAVTVKKIQLPFPKIQEQQKIADCLTSLDELIAAQAEKIEVLKMQKKGLMQGLFPNHLA